MEEEKKKDGRGGARPGAGRPKGVKKPWVNLSVAFPLEEAEELKRKAEKKGVSVSALIRELLRKTNGRINKEN